MKTSEKIDEISKALLSAQKGIGTAIKNKESHRNKYADLTAVIEAIKVPLNNSGISFLQLVQSGDTDTVATVLLHESGQYISTETRIYCNKPNDPQAFGSGVSYAKRYALQAALGLPTDDDDGKAASKTISAPTKRKPNASEENTIDVIWKKIDSGLPEDKCLSVDDLTTYFWNKAQKYPNDDSKCDTMAQWCLDQKDFSLIIKDIERE